MKCTDKVAYETRREAYEQVERLRKHSRKKKAKRYCQIYECAYCGKYHLSHFKYKIGMRKNNYFKDLSE